MTHDIDDVWSDLTPLFRWRGLTARWLPELGAHRLFRHVELLGAGAWGTLAECGWQELLPSAGLCPVSPILEADSGCEPWAVGMLNPDWAEKMVAAARCLAEAGAYVGPSGDAEHWLSYLCLGFSGPKAIFDPRVRSGSLPLTVAGGDQLTSYRLSTAEPKPSRRQNGLRAFEELPRVHRAYRRIPDGRRRYGAALVWEPGGYRIVHHHSAVGDDEFLASIEQIFASFQVRRVGGTDVYIDEQGERRVIHWDGLESLYPGDPGAVRHQPKGHGPADAGSSASDDDHLCVVAHVPSLDTIGGGK